MRTYARIDGIIEFPIIEYEHEFGDPAPESYTEAIEDRNRALKEEYDAKVSKGLQIFEQVQRKRAEARAAQEEEPGALLQTKQGPSKNWLTLWNRC